MLVSGITIMILLVMIAIIFDLFVDLKRSLAMAAFIMLLFRPEFCLQPGFQLSFIATKEIRMIAAYEMLNVRAYQMKNRYDIEYGEKGLGNSTEFQGV